jgi:hypothetical protein
MIGNDSTLTPRQPLGPQVFDRLRAEDEADWLSRVFVPPPDFAALAGHESLLILGESGSGKTALRQELVRQVRAGELPHYLIVSWQPTWPRDAALSGTPALQDWLAQAFDACAVALLEDLGRQPAALAQAKPYAQNTIVWFVHRYLQGDVQTHLSRLEMDCPPEGVAALQALFAREHWPEVLKPDAAPSRVIDILTEALTKQLQVTGVWLFIDGLDAWLDIDRARLFQTLKDLLSTLALYETPAFAFKILAPAEMRTPLLAVTGVARRRIKPIDLDWPVDKLQAMVETRLAAALGQAGFQLTDLYEAAKLSTWLRQYGGQLPRAWLEMMSPVFEAYLSYEPRRPLSLAELKAAQRRYIPPLRLNLDAGKAYLGGHEAPAMPPAAYNLLRYLFQNRHRSCTRSELYYLAHRRLEREPASWRDENWEHPGSWGRIIDTTLWRLREKIEPDPGHPVYIVSETVGDVNCVKLCHVW